MAGRREFPLLKQLHQRRPADAEEVSSLLRSESLCLRHDGDHFSLAQGFNDPGQDPVDLFGKWTRVHELIQGRHTPAKGRELYVYAMWLDEELASRQYSIWE